MMHAPSPKKKLGLRNPNSSTTITDTEEPKPIEAWATQISSAWQKPTGAIFQVGDLLLKAKTEIPHGAFIDLIRNKLPFNERTAQRLMQIARDDRMRNASVQTLLPPSIPQLVTMSRLDESNFRRCVEALRVGDRDAFRSAIHRTKLKPGRVSNLPRETGTDALEWIDLTATTPPSDVAALLKGDRSADLQGVSDFIETLQALISPRRKKRPSSSQLDNATA